MLYNAICISLFEKDKLLFSFLIGLKLMELNKIIDSQIIRFLMTGGVRTESKTKTPEVNDECKIWFNKVVWTKIEELSDTIPICHGFADKFSKNILEYNNILSSFENTNQKFPGLTDNFVQKDGKTTNEKMDIKFVSDIKELFLKLIVIRICKPE